MFDDALLVGSSGNLGPIWQRSLEAQFKRVILADLTDPEADYQVDLSDEASLDTLALKIQPLDALVINAGLDSKVNASMEEAPHFDRGQWERFFQVNVIGPVALIYKLLPKLKPKARIVAIGSIYGLLSPRLDVYNGAPDGRNYVKHPGYGSSKAALLQTFRQLATHYAGQFSFNMLTIGMVEGDQPEHFKKTMRSQIPTGNFLQRETLGHHLNYLLDAVPPTLIGHNLIVDDGYSLW
jgi:NAD(P)-dependent dehydrogenase (short-subunit alcohol dehydrogenase family)